MRYPSHIHQKVANVMAEDVKSCLCYYKFTCVSSSVLSQAPIAEYKEQKIKSV